MAITVAIPGMRRINHRVQEMCYAADVGIDGLCTVDIPAMPTNSGGAILSGQLMTTAGSSAPVASFNPTTMLGRYGRVLVVAGNAASTAVITIAGNDYLGQPIKETITMNGVTPVVGKKAFADVSLVTWPATAAVTLIVGFSIPLGVPYKILSTQLIGELVSDVTPTAGALTAGVNVQTLTSNDPRGLYTPNQGPDGTRWYRFTCVVDRSNLHGAAHVIV